jgi:hypothetical protein
MKGIARKVMIKLGYTLLKYSVLCLFLVFLGSSNLISAQVNNECALDIDFLRSKLELSPAIIIDKTDAENSSELKLAFPISGSDRTIDVTMSYYACYHIGIAFSAENISHDDLQIILPWIADRVRILDISSASYIDRLSADFGKVIKSGEIRTTGFYTLNWYAYEPESAFRIYNFRLGIDGAL